jgi:hypothetical protein
MGLSVAALGTTIALSIAATTARSADQDVQISANVPSFCSIAGANVAPKLSTTIPVDSAGVVDTSLQTFNVGAVVCNTSTSITATSMRGGVKSATKVGTSGFTNIINYKGTATFGGAKSTLNTGTLKGANGPEAGSTGTTAGPHLGSLTVTILPVLPTSPLAAGVDYWDTLRVDLVPD